MNGLVKEGSIGAILFQSRIISEQELTEALEEQKTSGGRVGEALIRLGVVTQEDIDWALSHQLDIPYVRLKKDRIDARAVALVPAELARRYRLFPLFLSGNELSVAMADPLDKEAIEELGRVTGCRIVISVGLIREIRELQDHVWAAGEAVPELGFGSRFFSAKVLESINRDLTGATLLNHLLLCAVRQKLSLLALQPLGEEVRIIARGDGKKAEIGRLAATHYRVLTERIRRLAGLPGGGGISASGLLQFRWQGKRLPFRALLIGGDGGEYVTLKLQISAPPLADLADLALPPSKARDLRALVAERQGLILFSGREPEERCRLIDLFLDARDDRDETVLLVGERLGRGGKRFPRLPVNRCGVDDTGSVLAAALDHDPDTLVVEDATEVAAFIEASKAVMRGKLVVAGMSYPDKESVLKQLLYLREKNFLITGRLKGMVSCKAVLLLCPACKERYQPTPEELAPLKQATHQAAYFRARGCPACDHTGFSTKRYLLDVIRFDQELLEAFDWLREGSEIVHHLKDNGYRGITEEGAELLERGEISPDEYVASILL